MKNLFTAIAAFSSATIAFAGPADKIKLNQVGYYPQQEKIIVVENPKTSKITVTDANGKKVLTAKRINVTTSQISGKKRSTFDVSSITTPGIYTINADNEAIAMNVKEEALTDLTAAAIKSFYYQRTAMPLTKEYAGKWARPMGHPDNFVKVHSSAASAFRPEGTVISSPKGWYDAGDYNKYITNSAFSMGVMYGMYELYPEYFNALKVDIPEKGNKTSDLLDENMYNLEWMFTMQDIDGGCYHKLTTPSFEGFIMPDKAKQQRYVVKKTVTATYEFAAVMAKAARIYKNNTDYPGTDARCINAARAAYEWAKKNPKALYHQDRMNKEFKPAVTTGAYGDGDFRGEMFWAAVELYITTGEEAYLKDAISIAPTRYNIPTWGETYMLGAYALLALKDVPEAAKQLYDQQRALVLGYAEEKSAMDVKSTSFYVAYGNKDREFGWGCLAEGFCGQGIAMLYAYKLTGEKKYLTCAMRDADAVLGRNATGYCYVTGFGVKSPMHPHHRVSGSNGIEDPVPGFIVGGPNGGQQDKGNGIKYPSDYADESYADVTESYASNEVAINWSASLVALAGGIDAAMKK